MSALFNKVLVLNKAWMPIGVCSVKKALEDMNSSKHPKKAIKIEYQIDEIGKPDYSMATEIIPLAWDEWITLFPREYDEECVKTAKLTLRVPTVVIVGSNYDKMPVKTHKPTKFNIYSRYGGRDYWTGEQLSLKEMTIDHVISRDEWKRRGLKGSPNNWGNLAPTKGQINRMKSNMPPAEFEKRFGFKPHYKLSEPKPVSAVGTIRATNPDWVHFLGK